jgi:RNA polymerase sigma-70 factor (ECF subfamily)
MAYYGKESESPEEAHARSEREGLVRRALSRLPEKQREVVSMHRFEGLSLREIARTLDIPLATTASRFYAGLSRLKHYLSPLMKEGFG